MPRWSELRTAVLANLARELRFASREALARHVERCEALLPEIEPTQGYPGDWIVFRITGYRPESAGDADLVRGCDLLADLPPLTERLSAAAGLNASELAASGGLDRRQLGARWRVSAKTLDRFRRAGLVSRRARNPRGRTVSVFMPGVVEWFERAHADQVARAGAFSRLGSEVEARLVRRAARYRAKLGWSRNRIAARLAARFGRSHEAVRQLLKRARETHDGAPVFDEPIPADARVALRAWDRGIGVVELASRWERPRAAIARVVLIARAQRVAGALKRHARGGTPAPSTVELGTLAHPAVVTGLSAPPVTDLAGFIRAARERSVIVPAEEWARAAAARALLWRAGDAIGVINPRAPRAGVVDRAERDLRWAILLRIRLMRTQLPLLVQTLDGVLGGPIEELPGGLTVPRLADLLRAAWGALGDATDSFHPDAGARRGSGARLAGAAGLAIARATTRWVKESGHTPERRPSRARGVLLPGVVIEDWTAGIWAEQSWLWPPARVRDSLPTLDPTLRGVIERRYGWGGVPPITIEELARERGITVARASALERRAVRAALAGARTR